MQGAPIRFRQSLNYYMFRRFCFHILSVVVLLLAACHPVRAVAGVASLHELEATSSVAVSTKDTHPGTATPDRRKKKQQEAASQMLAPDAMPRQAAHDRALDGSRPSGFSGGTTEDFDHNIKSREGIDVSHYQGHIDWERVAREGGISYMYAKATEGANYVDNTHSYNITMAHKYGIKVGSYHYYRPLVSIDEQFANLTAVVHKDEQDLVPMIDIEEDKGVSEEKFIADLTAFIKKVEKFYGKKPLLYSGEYFYNRHFQGLFQDYQWMMARYSSTAPNLKDGKTYLMWQYSDKGRIPGIPVLVDRSCLVGNGSLNAAKMK